MERELVATNLREYILIYLSTCGEMVSKGLAGHLPYSDSFVRSELRKLKEEKIIIHHRYDDGKRYYRLSEPSGSEALKALNQNLFYHMGLMVGEEGARYKGAKDRRIKQRRIYEICGLFLNAGISVDGISIEKAPNDFGQSESKVSSWGGGVFEKDGALKTIPEILGEVNPEHPEFITTKALKKLTDTVVIHPRTHMYRAIGLLMRGKSVYSVYSLGGSGDIWWKDAESQLAAQTQRQFKKYAKGCQNEQIEKRMAIFYVPTAKIMTEFVMNHTRKVRIRPNDVYNLSYIIPISENAEEITKMLLIRDWKSKLDEVLIANRPEKPQAEDGFSEDGQGVFNMLCCNVGRMKDMAPRIKRTKALVIIHEWMEELARELYGEEIALIKITDEQFATLRKAIDTE